MSWDYHYYEATCKKCGRKGFKIYSDDDWNRREISWNGFEPITDSPMHDNLVERKRIDANDYAKCVCGSTDIEIGNLVKTE